MPVDMHVVEVNGPLPSAFTDRLKVVVSAAVATAAGGSAGASVTTAFTFTEAGMPAGYVVSLCPNQDAVCYVTSKTSAGFNIVMNPRLATNTLAVGTVDILVFA